MSKEVVMVTLTQLLELTIKDDHFVGSLSQSAPFIKMQPSFIIWGIVLCIRISMRIWGSHTLDAKVSGLPVSGHTYLSRVPMCPRGSVLVLVF